jgi:hypothetical protein
MDYIRYEQLKQLNRPNKCIGLISVDDCRKLQYGP